MMTKSKDGVEDFAKHLILRETGFLEVDIRPICSLVRNRFDNLIHFLTKTATTRTAAVEIHEQHAKTTALSLPLIFRFCKCLWN